MIGAGLASLEKMSVTSMQAVRGERLKNGALKLQQTLPVRVGPLDPTTSHGAMPDTNVSNLQPASNTVSSGQEKNGLDADEDSDEELQASGLKWLRMDLTRAELKQGQDKLVELVQVSVRTASPLSCSPPTNPYTHPTQDLHVCRAKLFTLTSPSLEPETPRRAAGDQGAAGAGRDDGCTIVMDAA